MTTLRFAETIALNNINPYVFVSGARAGKLRPAWRKPLPVLLRIDGKPETPWRINLMPIGDGGFYLYLSGKIRKESGTQVGDKIQIEIRFDAEYRNGPMHPMPAWFHEALKENPKAEAAWKALVPSRQKELLRYFSTLKSAEAKARNLQKAMQVLSGKEGRFMARDWKDGR